MSFVAVAAKLKVKGFTKAQEDSIWADLEFAYVESDTARKMLDDWIAVPGNTIEGRAMWEWAFYVDCRLKSRRDDCRECVRAERAAGRPVRSGDRCRCSCCWPEDAHAVR